MQRILAELRSLSYILQPNAYPLIVRKQLELPLAYGHTPSSPTVFASCGLLLVMGGTVPVASASASRPATGRTAGVPEARPETLYYYLNFIRHWRHPVHEGSVSSAKPSKGHSTGVTRNTPVSSRRWCSPSRSGSAARWRRSTPLPNRSSPRFVPSPCLARSAKPSSKSASI